MHQHIVATGCIGLQIVMLSGMGYRCARYGPVAIGSGGPLRAL